MNEFHQYFIAFFIDQQHFHGIEQSQIFGLLLIKQVISIGFHVIKYNSHTILSQIFLFLHKVHNYLMTLTSQECVLKIRLNVSYLIFFKILFFNS